MHCYFLGTVTILSLIIRQAEGKEVWKNLGEEQCENLRGIMETCGLDQYCSDSILDKGCRNCTDISHAWCQSDVQTFSKKFPSCESLCYRQKVEDLNRTNNILENKVAELNITLANREDEVKATGDALGKQIAENKEMQQAVQELRKEMKELQDDTNKMIKKHQHLTVVIVIVGVLLSVVVSPAITIYVYKCYARRRAGLRKDITGPIQEENPSNSQPEHSTPLMSTTTQPEDSGHGSNSNSSSTLDQRLATGDTSRMYSAAGPCFLEGWDCPENYLPCYQDCCLRGLFFCNHAQQRCQKCDTVEQLCGNQTALPWQCDVYCLKKGMPDYVPSEVSGMVSVDYMYATYALGFSLFILAIIQACFCFFSRRRSHQVQLNSPSHLSKNAETVSLTASVEAPSDNLTGDDTGTSTVGTDTASTDSHDHGESKPTAMPTCRASDLCVPQVTLQPLGQNLVSHTNTPPVPGTATFDENLINFGLQSPQPVSSNSHAQHQVTCHDSRLDNISPTNNGENEEISVHTGMSPFRPMFSTAV